MNRLLRCRRCGALFMPDRFAGLLHWWRLCPHCRGPLPPISRVLGIDGGRLLPCPPEAA